MERIAQYRQAIRKLLSDRVVSAQGNSESEIESQLIFDTEHDRYQLLDIG
jgi:XisI protein